MRIAALIVSMMFVPPDDAAAHPGGLNGQGCHNNRKTGDYHCHRGGGGQPAPSRAARSTETRFNSNGGGDSTYYRNCTAAREAGVAPIRRGQPGYASHLDRDGDGIACE